MFDGQQSDERILATLTPEKVVKYGAVVVMAILASLFFLMISSLQNFMGPVAGMSKLLAGILGVVLVAGSVWWNNQVLTKTRTYITDRRIIRFEIIPPFFRNKRALFWNEAMKAKGYAPNIFFRILKIGNVQVEPVQTETEDVLVTEVSYFEDIANYIDKILFLVKNRPSEITTLKPFVAKPKGQRG